MHDDDDDEEEEEEEKGGRRAKRSKKADDDGEDDGEDNTKYEVMHANKWDIDNGPDPTGWYDFSIPHLYVTMLTTDIQVDLGEA